MGGKVSVDDCVIAINARHQACLKQASGPVRGFPRGDHRRGGHRDSGRRIALDAGRRRR